MGTLISIYMNINTKPHICTEKKAEVLEYLQTHNQHATAKHFGIGYNTISFWIDPEYKKYSLEKTQANRVKNKDTVYGHIKKYTKERRKTDPLYVAKRNEAAKKWQKEKRRKDPEWRERQKSISNQYFETHKHTSHSKAVYRRASRNRRAMKRNINENYTVKDEAYTKKLFNNRCVVCGATDNLTIDHWFPLSHGHALTRSNAVVMCWNCNRLKSDTMPEEYFLTVADGDAILNRVAKKLKRFNE